jgi:predicted nucleotidyltransferase
MTVQLEQKHLDILKEILQKFSVEVYVFGSRAKGNARKLSDLDLCIKQEIDKSTLRKFKDSLEESNLPFKVDVVVWDELSDAFKSHIEKDLSLIL